MDAAFWPAITLRQSPPSASPRSSDFGSLECELWLGARDSETRRHYWKGHAGTRPRDRVSVERADLLDRVPGELDLVVANLPYLSDALRGERPELAGEPSKAVFAPGDGLGLYRRLVEMCSRMLRPEGALALQLHRRVLVAEAPRLAELDLAA